MANITYKAKADCTAFGHFRKADEEFIGPAWADTYDWPMPDHIEVVGGQGEAPNPPKGAKAPKPGIDLG